MQEKLILNRIVPRRNSVVSGRMPLYLAVSALLLVFSCTEELLYENTIPDFKAPADKALCVILRKTEHAPTYSPVWVDKKYVGGTGGDAEFNTVTSFTVEPGSHMILTEVSHMSKIKLNFKAGKIYYIFMTSFPVPYAGTITALSAMPAEEAITNIETERSTYRFAVPNPEYIADDLSMDEYQEELEDYEEWTKEEPGKAEAEARYPGY